MIIRILAMLCQSKDRAISLSFCSAFNSKATKVSPLPTAVVARNEKSADFRPRFGEQSNETRQDY
jgi:hypothetical protein